MSVRDTIVKQLDGPSFGDKVSDRIRWRLMLLQCNAEERARKLGLDEAGAKKVARTIRDTTSRSSGRRIHEVAEYLGLPTGAVLLGGLPALDDELLRPEDV
tara:strand:- start:2252 stop:2554 length:303 start_codon:yes stop_codon:yes gene_type:complete